MNELEKQNKLAQENFEIQHDKRLKQEHSIMMAQRRMMEVNKVDQFNK